MPIREGFVLNYVRSKRKLMSCWATSKRCYSGFELLNVLNNPYYPPQS